MQTIDYETLLQANKPKGYVSKSAHGIANRLICELNIQTGYGLAAFLEVDTSLDNHKALRIWVQKWLDESDSICLADREALYGQIKAALFACVPQVSLEF